MRAHNVSSHKANVILFNSLPYFPRIYWQCAWCHFEDKSLLIWFTYNVKTKTYQVWILHDGNNNQFCTSASSCQQIQTFLRPEIACFGGHILITIINEMHKNLFLWLVGFSVRSCVYVIAYHLNLIKTVCFAKLPTMLIQVKFKRLSKIQIRHVGSPVQRLGIRARVCVSPLSSYLYTTSMAWTTNGVVHGQTVTPHHVKNSCIHDYWLPLL